MLQMQSFNNLFLKFKSNLLVRRPFFLLNAVFAIARFDLISHVHLASFVITLPRYLEYSPLSGCFVSIIIRGGDIKCDIE